MISFKSFRNYSVAFSFAVFLSATGGAAQQKSFTLEQVLSAPFPDDLTAAPAGGKIAWVFNDKGVRNVWVAEPEGSSGEYKSRALTNYAEDDGQEIAELFWLPDAGSIVYVRGGDFENGGDYPNPASNPAGVDQGIWIVPLSGGAPRRLAEGHSPAISPKDGSVAYIYKDQVWQVKISG